MVFKSGYSLNWAHSLCENCLRNAHKEEKVVLKTVVSPNDETKYAELYVCSKCGATRKL